jgi:quercetin dioxygenase-like cupin family protein
MAGVRRIVTGHDETGLAIIASISEPDGFETADKDAIITNIWATANAIADNNNEQDGREYIEGLVNKEGVVFRVLEVRPHSVSPFHRTISLDFGIVIEGSIQLVLDNGLEQDANAGDTIVQRGTIHAWRNITDKVCKIAFILIPAHPVNINGKPLEATQMHGDFRK